MNIYNNYIFYDKLVSPVNGYTCKCITTQNIKKFGFDSLDDFKTLYPNFPLVCESLSLKRSTQAKKQHKDGHNTKIKNSRIDEEKKNYNPKKCIRCDTLITFENRKSLYCSRSCANSRKQSEKINEKRSESLNNYYKSLNKSIPIREVNCSVCNKVTYKKTKKINKTNLYACDNDSCKTQLKSIMIKMVSHKGASKGGRSSAKNQVRRSRQEIELYNLLLKHFDNISHNEPIVNGWDADILLNDQKIAILWNGPWHYREMNFGNHSLEQVVNRDCIKIQEFENIGWNVLIYEDSKWSPQEAMIDVILEAGNRVERLKTSL